MKKPPFMMILLAALLAPASASVASELAVLSFNIRSARGTGLNPEFDAAHLSSLTKMITELAPDVLFLQEIDRGVARTDRTDQFEYIELRTGLTGRFAHAVDYQGGRFGIAVFTRHPIVSYREISLPQWGGKEPRVLQHLRIRASGREFDLFNTHIDPRLASRDRQIRLVLERTVGEGPAVLAGDFNVPASNAVIGEMRGKWRDAGAEAENARSPTYPARAPVVRIDFMFFRDLELLEFDTFDSRGISDHRALFAKFALDR